MRVLNWIVPVLALGCAGPEASVRRFAAQDMKCAEGQLVLSQPKPTVNLFLVDGCSETGRYVAACNTFGYCPTIQGEVVSDLILKQAAFDLQCEAGAVHLSALNADTFGARGCGRQASYLLLCDTPPCKAIQNTQTQVRQEDGIGGLQVGGSAR